MAEEQKFPSLNQNKNSSSKESTEFFQGYWYRPKFIPRLIAFQKHFQAHDTDIIITSKPKSGTTWLKSLVFSIVNRTYYSLSNTPLITSNPHELVPAFDFYLYKNNEVLISSPRVYSTHFPYSSLPESFKQSDCRIVYIARYPCDVIVSWWHFLKPPKSIALEECYEMFCCGEEPFGPYWDHVLGYWKESLERPNKVLFLKYEDMKKDPVFNLKKLAEFIGFPFSKEEEEMGLIHDILQLCSFENLKNLTVNQEGKDLNFIRENKTFFRKGEVGDSANFLSPSAIEHLSKIVEEKLSGSGLTFKMS